MIKNDFYRWYVKPYLKKHDKPFNRQLFNDSKDTAHKNGWISEKQANEWIYPNTKYFE